MLEAEEVLGQRPNPKTEAMAKLLVDHALCYGWDDTYGGFYRDGTTVGKPEDLRKEWWVQFEGLNALLLMHEKYGKQTDVYLNAFQKQWRFIKDRQIDHEFGGVYDTVERDGTVRDYTKARIWKEAYHESRALLNVTARLSRLARDASASERGQLHEERVPGAAASVATAQAQDSQGILFSLPVEAVVKVPSFDWITEVIVRLPDEFCGSRLQ